VKIKKLFFIPARAGSKGIKNKNILLLNNKMLFEWSVFAAYQSMGEYDMVCISTNCDEIFYWYEHVIKKHFSEHLRNRIIVIKRPESMCQDRSSTEEAIIDCLSQLYLKGYEVDDIVLLQPTSPIRIDDIIYKCIQSYYNNHCRYTVFSASKNTPFNWCKNDDLFLPRYEFKDRKMRQDIEEKDFNWHEDGSVYVFSNHVITMSNNRMTDRTIAIENSTINSIQIDSNDDLDIVNALVNIERVNLWMKNIQF
jgi:CMP-N,N'-diacetyllegionaminic acid synthase